MPVAQRGSQDDCIRVNVVNAGGQNVAPSPAGGQKGNNRLKNAFQRPAVGRSHRTKSNLFKKEGANQDNKGKNDKNKGDKKKKDKR
jgi:hypothetical protein